MAKKWKDLTPEEQRIATETGVWGPVLGNPLIGAVSIPDEILKFISDAPFRDDFMTAFPDAKGGAIVRELKNWTAEEPIRQQERTASATIDLSMENIPEIIAGGTARAAQGKKQRRPASATSPIVTALGLGMDSAPAKSNKDWLSLGIM